MAYVFNRLNSLVSDRQPTNSGGGIPSGGATAISGAMPKAGTESANPTQSTFKNPSTLIQRNLQAGTGAQTGLKTAENLNKNVQNVQSGLTASNQDFENQMQKTRQGFDFTQDDVKNADKARLAPILNADTQSIQNAKGTNVNDFNADLRGVRALGSDEGTRTQLKNQYGYGSGSAALDNLLYRGSGQAARDIRQSQADLQGLNAMKQNIQGSQAASRQATVNYANQRSGELKGALNTQQNALRQQASTAAQAANAQAQAAVDAQKAKLLEAGVNLKRVPISFEGGNMEGYLDPSYNRIAELLGTQVAGPGIQARANFDQGQIDQILAEKRAENERFNTPDAMANDRLIQEGRDRVRAQQEKTQREAMEQAERERQERDTWYGQPLYAANQAGKLVFENGVAPTVNAGVEGTEQVWDGTTGTVKKANDLAERGFSKIGKLF